MSNHRYARKRDTAERPIIDELERAGWAVFQELPCDLLLFKAGQWRTLEVKTAKNRRNDPRHDKRQKAQAAFLALTGTPIAVTPAAALMAVGSLPPGPRPPPHTTETEFGSPGKVDER